NRSNPLHLSNFLSLGTDRLYSNRTETHVRRYAKRSKSNHARRNRHRRITCIRNHTKRPVKSHLTLTSLTKTHVGLGRSKVEYSNLLLLRIEMMTGLILFTTCACILIKKRTFTPTLPPTLEWCLEQIFCSKY